MPFKKLQQELRENKRLEKVLIFQRWLYVPAILFTGWLYSWPSAAGIILIALGLALANVAGYYANKRISGIKPQRLLCFFLLGADFLAGWALIFILEPGNSLLVYIIFYLIIIETGIRFELRGALVMDVIFALGALTIIYLLPSSQQDVFPAADYLLLLGVTSFSSLMVGMVAREWRKQRRYAEQLAAERALLLERRRISSELHDSILKSLQGLSMEAYSMAQGEAHKEEQSFSQKASYIQEVCQLLSRQIRGVILELRDEDATQEIDVVWQMRELAGSWGKRTGIEVEYTAPSDITGLPPKLLNDLQNIFTEALHNIERHTQATLVSIQIKLESGIIILTISDNGQGFEVESDGLSNYLNRGKLGLISMKERAELSGGGLEIISSSEGTSLHFNIPVKGKPL